MSDPNIEWTDFIADTISSNLRWSTIPLIAHVGDDALEWAKAHGCKVKIYFGNDEWEDFSPDSEELAKVLAENLSSPPYVICGPTDAHEEDAMHHTLFCAIDKDDPCPWWDSLDLLTSGLPMPGISHDVAESALRRLEARGLVVSVFYPGWERPHWRLASQPPIKGCCSTCYGAL